MAHVITDACTKCLNCAAICPVSCIHPAGDEPDLANAAQLYIDPGECIDCGSCVPECPVEAIFPEADLPPDQQQAVGTNAAYFKK